MINYIQNATKPSRQFGPHSFTPEQIELLFLRLRQTPEELLYDHDAGESSIYSHQEHGGEILGVAHCDYVQGAWSYPRFTDADKTRIRSGQVDDRVGVWLLLDVLPTLPGMPIFDVLLTTDEEIGRSTAQDFGDDTRRSSVSYNWCFQFDRRGHDWVDYDKASDVFRQEFTQITEIEMGQGTFSDICYLPKSFGSRANIGTGYHNEHSPDAYVDLNECWHQVQSFARFAAVSASTRYPMRKEPKRVFRSSYTARASSYRDGYGWPETSRAAGAKSLGWGLPDDVSLCPIDIEDAGNSEVIDLESLTVEQLEYLADDSDEDDERDDDTKIDYDIFR